MATSEQTRARGGKYVDAGGVHTYYEVTGTGEPLVLLHGGFCPAETWDAQTPALAENFQVYVPERRGHGRTPDVEGPITYENMARDTIAFMEAVGVSSAHLVGWSDGANVGLLVALERPDLVRKLVFMGSVVNHEGYRREWDPALVDLSLEAMPPMFEQMYAAVSPDGPDHFGVIFDKLKSTWQAEPSMQLDELSRVAAPTLGPGRRRRRGDDRARRCDAACPAGRPVGRGTGDVTRASDGEARDREPFDRRLPCPRTGGKDARVARRVAGAQSWPQAA